MHLHIHTKAAASWLPRAHSVLFILTLVLVSSQGIESIVKQQQQQQQQQAQQQSQQQRSDDIALQQQNGNSNNPYNNHHQPSSSPAQSASVSSSAGQMSGQGPQQQQQQQQSSPSSSQSQSQAVAQQSAPGGRPPMDLMSGYAPASQKASAATYSDSMTAAASNPEQSYQAAAQSVNMALANSGIFGSSGQNSYQPQPQQQQQPQQQNSNQMAAAASGNPSSLNPLHYFYYPAKDNANSNAGGLPSSSSPAVSSSASAGSRDKQLAGGDMVANAATNSYQSMAAYPSYTDQYSSGSFGASAMGGVATPDAAASSQDPSYLPQPSMDQYGQPMGNGNGNSNNNNNNNMPGQNGQQFGSDLSGYASSPIQSSVPSSISFNGPSSSSANGGSQQQQQQQQQSNGMMSLGQNEYLNSHMGGQQQQQQPGSVQQQQASQQQPASYQNSLFNQLASGGDLSTSNFGNNAGGLSSIAMYMPPNNQQQQQAGHDLFSGSALGTQFNSAASQLAPAAIAPPQQHPQAGQQQSQQASLFSSGGASSLFGTGSQQQPGASQQQTYGPSSIQGAHNYLSSFLTPQQYTQMTGQQLPMASEQSPLSIGGPFGSLQQQQGALSSPSQAASSIMSGSSATTAASSSKRFGLSSFIMPMLALAGLSLLIPTVSSFSTAVGRKKRSIVEERASASNRQQQIGHESMNGANQIHKENSIGEYMDKIERYYAIYKNAVESDDCLNRLICEFGDAVKDVTGRGAVVTVIEKLLPNWMSGKMHLFKEAALGGGPSGKEKCKKYVCQSNRQQQ